MRLESKSRLRLLAGALVPVVALTLVAPPCFAAEAAAAKPAARPATLAAAAAARVAAADASVALAQEPSSGSGDTARSFFASPKGVAAIILFAAGTAWTFRSKSKDRVKSPIRD